MSDEIVITSAVIVRPGDKVLLVMSKSITPAHARRMREALEQWAPGVDWLVADGIEAVYQKAGEPSESAR